LLQIAALNPELRNLVPYAWDRRVALHPFNLDQVYALGGQRGRGGRGRQQPEEDEEAFKPTGRYAGLAERLRRGSGEEDDDDEEESRDGGGGGSGAIGGVRAGGVSSASAGGGSANAR
ncbi:hypothetical protein Agub_g10555, partial [Astrephomene gubernaculifera]